MELGTLSHNTINLVLNIFRLHISDTARFITTSWLFCNSAIEFIGTISQVKSVYYSFDSGTYTNYTAKHHCVVADSLFL
jgi:hypothetical protein